MFNAIDFGELKTKNDKHATGTEEKGLGGRDSCKMLWTSMPRLQSIKTFYKKMWEKYAYNRWIRGY